MSKSKSRKDVPVEDRRDKPRMEPYHRQHTDWRNLLLEDEALEEIEDDEHSSTS